MRTRKYTDEQFIESYNKSCCWKSTMLGVNLKYNGGITQPLKDYAFSLGLDGSKFSKKCMNHKKDFSGQYEY